MDTAAYDYSFSPSRSGPCAFNWEYAQQRNTMDTALDAIERELLESSSQSRLYDFTKTVNALPRHHAALISGSVLRQIVENLYAAHISRDARIAVLHIYASKFGHPHR